MVGGWTDLPLESPPLTGMSPPEVDRQMREAPRTQRCPPPLQVPPFVRTQRISLACNRRDRKQCAQTLGPDRSPTGWQDRPTAGKVECMAVMGRTYRGIHYHFVTAGHTCDYV